MALLLGMIALYLLGARLVLRFSSADKNGASTAAETAVFSLLGLLLSFTFFSAASRLEDRRHLVTQQATQLQARIWSEAVSAVRLPDAPPRPDPRGCRGPGADRPAPFNGALRRLRAPSASR